MVLPLIMMVGIASAQKKVITGKVIDQTTGKPLIGVSIISDKKKVLTVTDDKGIFSIKPSADLKSLSFSFIGYATQFVVVMENASYNVSMVPEATAQAEVVVIGYGTQKKSSLTGAVAKYKNDKLDESPVSRLDQALQGRIAGVVVQNTQSEAGATPKINIRGISSINAGANPLVVVDGMPVPDGLAFINMGDVESVEVLKDAASAAIYGSRGASGVILVTTKKGVADKPKYTFKYSLGQKEVYKRYDIMTTKEYVAMLFDEVAMRKKDPSVDQTTNSVSEGDKASYVIENLLRNGEATDWQSQSLRTGQFQNLQLNVSGGKKDLLYFISGGYQKDGGMMYKSNYEKFNVRAKVDVTLAPKVKLSFNINPSYSTRQTPSENYTNFWRVPSFLPVYHTAATAALVNTNPQYALIKAGDYAHLRHFQNLIYSGVMPDGTNWMATTGQNPSGSAQQNPRSSVDRSDINVDEYRMQSSADLTVNLLPGLNFKSMLSSYLYFSNGLEFYQRNQNSDGANNYGTFSNKLNVDLLNENTLNYTKSIKNHDITILGGFTAQKTTVNTSQTTGLDFPSDDIRTLNSSAQLDKSQTYGTKNQIGLISYLGRINYTYNDKYLLSSSFRADGSSYFGPGHKWGTFPSLSIGWVASKEKLLSKINWLSNLKFRGSYGVSGNNRITDFAFLDLLYGANYPFGSGTGISTPGLSGSQAFLSNPNITWESTFQTNVGLDLSLLKNRINLSVDVYKSKTDKLLLQQSAMAFTGVPQFWNNLGSLQNKGFEIELNTKNIQGKNFKWSTSGNLSHNENKILQLGTEAYLLNQGERTEVYRNKVGEPLTQFYGFKTDGVWLSQDQITASGLTSILSNVLVPGGLKIVDTNGDNVIDNNDRTIIGSPYPKFTWGLTNNISYKSFDLSFTFQGVQGGMLINGDPNYNESRRVIRVYNQNRWVSPMFPGDGRTPYSTLGYNWMLTDYVIQDGSYYSLRDLNLGYTVPKSVLRGLKINSMRFYISAQNLYFHFAKSYKGLNPEGRSSNGAYSSSLIDGYQRGSFPVPRTILGGIDISF